MLTRQKAAGFTLVELLMATMLLAILVGLATFGYGAFLNNIRRQAADSDINKLVNATKLYISQYNVYPPDVSRDIPPEIKAFIDSQDESDNWPDAPWPGSVFDYDHWTIEGEQTVQISIRFCPAGGPLSACKFPNEPWTNGFNINSAYYYCIKGKCRSHSAEAATYPGFCINCPDNKAVGT